MAKPVDQLYATLVIAFVLIGVSSFLSSAGHLMLPAQNLETRSELKQSQSTGKPISDEDIERHLNRLKESRTIYWLICIPNLLSAVAMTIAFVPLARVDRPISAS